MLELNVRKYIKEKKLLKPGDKVIAAISGGPDSLCMLHMLLTIQKDLNTEIYVAHLNHLFRRESHSEFEFVRSIAKRWHLPFYGVSIDVPAYREKKKISSQMAARECRYKFLLKAAAYYDANIIATGHQRDDQAETVLMNILSGTGLKGITGIRAKQTYRGVKVIRPLLETSRKDIIMYCSEKNISTIDDSSNLKDIYRRNKVRLKLLPYLEREFNPNIAKTLTRLTALASADNEYLDTTARKIFLKNSRWERDGSLYIDLSSLDKLHLSLKRRVVREAWLFFTSGRLRPLSSSQTDSVINIWDKGISGKNVSLPQNAVAGKVYNGLVLYLKKESEAEKGFKPLALQIPGRTYLGHSPYFFECIITKKEKLKWPLDEKREAYFDLAKLTMPVKVRMRRPGDYLFPLGMNGRKKKLKDIFNDKKIVKSHRDSYPLLVSGKDIIWVTGLAVSEKTRITEDTDKALIVRLCEKYYKKEC